MKYRVLRGKNGIKEAYDLMAEIYDKSKYLFWTRRLERGEERVVRRWLRSLSEPCLDVGCGTGRYSLKLAEGGKRVVALDISLKMVRKLLDKAERSSLLRSVDAVVGDGEKMPFRDRAFGSAICTLAFDHFENPERAAEELSRVLKGDSLCVITTFNSTTLGELQRRYRLGNNVTFRIEKSLTVLVYEVGHSAEEVVKLFYKYRLKPLEVKGCCYWHVLPKLFAFIYPSYLDSFFGRFRALLKYAEIHASLLRAEVDA